MTATCATSAWRQTGACTPWAAAAPPSRPCGSTILRPARSLSLGIPDTGATLARAVAATDETVFFGAGSTLGGGGSAGRACLWAYNRAAQTFTQVTPTEMLADPSIRELAILGDKLVVSSAASTQQSKVALMDLANPASYSVATSIGKTAKNFTSIGGQVYFANETGLCAYSVAFELGLAAGAQRTVPRRNLGRRRPEQQDPGHLRLRLRGRDRPLHRNHGGHRPW